MTTAAELYEEAHIAQQIENLLSGDLQSGDKSSPNLMRDISDPDERTVVYSTLTGEPRAVPNFALDKTMRKKLPDGRRAFEFTQTQPWKQGETPCYLNEKHPRYNDCFEMGIVGVPCPAEHLASVYAQRMHMQNRHRQEWATIQENDRIVREEEEREDRRAMAAAARSAVATTKAARSG